MRKFAGSLVSFILIFFLCTSNVWAGDSEIRSMPGDQKTPSMPLTVSEPEVSEEVMTEPAPQPVVEKAAEEAVVEEVEEAAEAVVEEVEEAAEAVVEEVEKAVAVETPPPAPKDDLAIAAELIDAQGIENLKKALGLCEAAVKKDPNNFKANWMAAKACREYGEEAKELQLSDWKDICKLYGKKGMAYAEKAITLEPDKVNGYFWYGMNVGIYSDSVSILTALKEGESQFPLQLLHLLAEGGLADGGALGGTKEMPLAVEGGDVAELLKIHY